MLGTPIAQWLEHCAINLQIMGSRLCFGGVYLRCGLAAKCPAVTSVQAKETNQSTNLCQSAHYEGSLFHTIVKKLAYVKVVVVNLRPVP